MYTEQVDYNIYTLYRLVLFKKDAHNFTLLTLNKNLEFNIQNNSLLKEIFDDF